MTVWVMVLMMHARDMVVMPFHYETKEACEAAAKLEEFKIPGYVCIGGPVPKP